MQKVTSALAENIGRLSDDGRVNGTGVLGVGVMVIVLVSLIGFQF